MLRFFRNLLHNDDIRNALLSLLLMVMTRFIAVVAG